MELGEKLRLARQEAGLSQRQLCGDVITRNMLSQIEHGTARPSMDTLKYLASRLGRPMSFFLEEEAELSPNQSLMIRARQQWKEGNQAGTWLMLRSFQHPDPILEWEWKIMSTLTAFGAAEDAMQDGKDRYARQILEETAGIDHGVPGLERQRLLLLARIPEMKAAEIVSQLPSLDRELLLRAEAALSEKNGERALALLDAAEDRTDLRWYLLRGQAKLMVKDYALAAECLQNAETNYPEQCIPLLEECFRELGDYKRAYEYACKQR